MEKCRRANSATATGSFGHRPRLHGPELRLRAGGRQEDGIALIRAAVERGVTFFDTAEVYGPFVNEELVGEALHPFRDRSRSPPSSASSSTQNGAAAGPGQPAGAHQGGRRSVAQATQVDRIDLFYQHRVDPEVPIEDVAGAVKDLIRKARSSTSACPKRACGPAPRARGPAGHRAAKRIFAVVARAREGILPALEELGIGFVPFSPLGKGFLTGNITENTTFESSDFRNIVPRFSPRRARRTSRWSICSAPSRRGSGDAGPDRARVAVGPEAVDRAHPRHHQAAPAGGKCRRRRCRADQDDLRDIDGALGGDRGAGRALSRASAEARRPLSNKLL